MEQFNLDKWLENPSRKVVTRDGREVEIVKYDMKGTHFPVLYVISNEDGSQEPCECSKSGMCQFDNTQSSTDIFFADEEEESQSTEFSFGAFDSEFVRDEYLIPEGCEARIEGNKVIIEKIQKEEELTKFEKDLQTIISDASHWTSDDGSISTYCQFGDKEIKKISGQILDLARKEILKDLPKWKKMKTNNPYEPCIVKYTDYCILETSGYGICISELFEKLPKEE